MTETGARSVRYMSGSARDLAGHRGRCPGPGAGRGPLTLPHVTPAEVPDAVRGAFAGLPRVLRRHEGRLYTEPGLLSAIFHAIGSVRARTD